MDEDNVSGYTYTPSSGLINGSWQEQGVVIYKHLLDGIRVLLTNLSLK